MNKTWQWIVKVMTALILGGVTYLINDVRKLRDDMADVKVDVATINAKLSSHLKEPVTGLDWSNPPRIVLVSPMEKKSIP